MKRKEMKQDNRQVNDNKSADIETDSVNKRQNQICETEV